MPGKILSSRHEVFFEEALQELVLIAQSILGRDLDPADDEDELIEQLLEALIEIDERVDHDKTHIAMLSMDLISLSIRSTQMMAELKMAMKLIEALARPVVDDAAFANALKIMRREGDATIITKGDEGDTGAIEVDVELTFEENKLSEALKLAIAEYIQATAQAAIP